MSTNEQVRYWAPPRFYGPAQVFIVGPRALKVLQGVCEGLTNAEIGAKLYLAEDTVKTHLRRIVAATGDTNRGALIARAHAREIVFQVGRHARQENAEIKLKNAVEEAP